MARDLNCEFCNATHRMITWGVCTECEACFGEHCECDPCAHGKARSEECVFCVRGPGFGRGIELPPLADVMVQEAVENQMQADIDWLMMTHSEEMP